MDTARKHVRRLQQLANQNIGRAEKTEVITDDLHNVEQRVERMIDSLHHTKQKLTDCLRSRSKEDNIEKRRKKLVEYHFAQSLLSDSKNLEDLMQDSLLSQILSMYGNGMSNVVEELVQSDMNIERQVFEQLSKYSEESKSVATQKEKMKRAVLDLDSSRSRLANVQGKGEKNDVVLQDETNDCWNKVESCKDNWALELYTLAGKEIDMANTFIILVKLQMDYYRTAYKSLEFLLPFMQMKIDRYPKRPVYGCPLQDHLRYSNREIAVVLEVCCAALCELGLREEGLFRISGSSPKIRKLKAAFDIDEIDLNDFENHPHSIAGALKLYLRELPDPLMTHNLYSDWIRAVNNDDTETRLKSVKEVVAKLPSTNLANLRYLVKFLSKLCENQQYTKMNSQNLAIVLAPNMLWNPNNDEGFVGNSALATLVECLIANADYFFPGDIKFTSNRISTLINSTGGFVDSDSNFSLAHHATRNRSRSPSGESTNTTQSSGRPPSGIVVSQPGAPAAQPARRPKPPAPPPPPNTKTNAGSMLSSGMNVSTVSSASNEFDDDVGDPMYSEVSEAVDDDPPPEYSVPKKSPDRVLKLNLQSAQPSTPPEDPVVVENMSTSLIRTQASSPEDQILTKTHRKTNSLDRPTKPPRYSVNNVNDVSSASMQSLDRRPSPMVKKLHIQPPAYDDHVEQPSRPPPPTNENLEKHSRLSTKHSINLHITGGPSSGIVKSKVSPPPPPTAKIVGATHIEVEPPDEDEDEDINYNEGGHRGSSDDGKQAPLVTFRRNLFEKKEASGATNGDVAYNRSSLKKKLESVNEEKNGAAPPPRPKPPVPSKPKSQSEIDDMTRL